MKRRTFNKSVLGFLFPISVDRKSQLTITQYNALKHRIKNNIWVTWNDADCDALIDVPQGQRVVIWEFCTKKKRLKRPFTIEELMNWD